jgi:hypothetical protein
MARIPSMPVKTVSERLLAFEEGRGTNVFGTAEGEVFEFQEPAIPCASGRIR